MAVIEDLVKSLAESGFAIVFVNGHYTNYPAINLGCLNASPQPRGGRSRLGGVLLGCAPG